MKMRAFAPANLDKLDRAREETRWERERGRLRGPIRWRRVKVKIQGREMRMAAPRREEMKRRGRNAVAGGVTGETTQQQIPTSASRPHTAGRRPVPFDYAQDGRNDSAFLSYREVPEWAKGLPFAGGVGMAAGHGAGVRPPAATRTPKPVPFAFRRKR